MHACARALHDAVKASTPVERNFLQLGPGPFLGWGRRFCPWYCYRKTKKTKQKKTKKKYCTVEIPTEMEFTGTFQKYLQCVNRMWFSNIRTVCLSRLTNDSTVLQYRYYSTTVLQLYSCDSCSCATVVQSYSRAVPKIDCPLARKADKVHWQQIGQTLTLFRSLMLWRPFRSKFQRRSAYRMI